MKIQKIFNYDNFRDGCLIAIIVILALMFIGFIFITKCWIILLAWHTMDVWTKIGIIIFLIVMIVWGIIISRKNKNPQM